MPNKKTILITRPVENAISTAEKLINKYNIIESPLTKIIYNNDYNDKIDNLADKTTYIIATSFHAIKSLAQITNNRNYSIIIIGENSTKRTKELGFRNVVNAGNNADEMNNYILKTIPKNKPILYLRGQHIQHDIASKLTKNGYNIKEIVAYDAQEIMPLNELTITRIKQNDLDIILLYSSRSAAILEKIFANHKLTDRQKNIDILCLSEQISEQLTAKNWRNIHLAPQPNEQSLLDTLQSLY